MKIINIDAPDELVELFLKKDLPKSVRSFFEGLEKNYYKEFKKYQNITTHHPSHSPVRKFECGRYENMAVLWHTIPIYLRSMRREGQDYGIIDLLGAYFPNKTGDGPYIELYLTDIYSEAENEVETNHSTDTAKEKTRKKEEYFKKILTIVLIHELAHATLDIFNMEAPHSSEKVSYRTNFGRWHEESMANAVALRIIKEKSNSVKDKKTGKEYIDASGNPISNNTTIYNYAKEFMLSQTDEYALGALMEDFDADDFNSVFEAKIYGVDAKLQQEWLKYATELVNYAKGRISTPRDWDGLKALNDEINTDIQSRK
jgi:hypothetical protein